MMMMMMMMMVVVVVVVMIMMMMMMMTTTTMMVVVVTTRTRMQKLQKCMYSSVHTCLTSYNDMQSINIAKEKPSIILYIHHTST